MSKLITSISELPEKMQKEKSHFRDRYGYDTQIAILSDEDFDKLCEANNYSVLGSKIIWLCGIDESAGVFIIRRKAIFPNEITVSVDTAQIKPQVVSVIPFQKCPVCEGSGDRKGLDYSLLAGLKTENLAHFFEKKFDKCRVCEGAGVIPMCKTKTP